MTNGTVILNQTTNVIPTNGTSEVQTLVIGGTPTSGSIGFSWNGGATFFATWSATTGTLVANIQAALDSIFNSGGASAANIVASNSTLSSGIGNVLLTFQGAYSSTPQNLIVATNSLAGSSPTAAITRTTTGVTATDRQAAPLELLVFNAGGCSNAVQTWTIGGTPSAGTFTLSGTTAQNPGQVLTTAAITWSATNATLLANIDAELDTTFGENNIEVSAGTLTSGVGTILATFQGTNAFAAIPTFSGTIGTLDGTLAFATTTPGGVSGRTSAIPIPYRNYSTVPFIPSWLPSGDVILNLGSPAVGSSTAIHAAVTDTGSTINITTAITNTALAAVPRTIVLTPGGTTANVTATTCDIIGTDCNGNALTETTLPFTVGQATAVTTVNAFASVTKIVQRTTGSSVTIAYGTGPKIGLGVPITLNSVVNGWLGGTLEATRPVAVPSTTGLISGNLVSLTSSLSSTSAVQIQIAFS